MPDDKLKPTDAAPAQVQADDEVHFIDIDDLPDAADAAHPAQDDAYDDAGEDDADHDDLDHDAPTDDATDGTPAKPARKKAEKVKRVQQVYTLIVQVGRKANDGLPKHATGGALMLYASGVDEAEAVRESVAILKQADLAPLDVQGLGTLDERLKAGEEIDADEREMMQRALDENSVVVAQMTPFYD